MFFTNRRGNGAAATALALLLLAGAAPLAAQAGMGRVMGRVVSSQTGEPLAAVQVTIPAISRGTLSDANGRYLLTAVPAGTHDLVVQSLGYGRKTVTGIRVPGDAPTALDISLAPQAVALEGVTVSAAREQGSTTALLSERQRSAVVLDALGAEQISLTSDGDAASALKRVPGVSVVDGKFVYVRGLGERYGATTLNGAPLASPLPDKKAVPLDLIPASLLESVVTAKTYSPDQPGDYAGGLVQLETRNFPSSRLLKLSTSVGFEGNTSLQQGLGYSGGGLDWLGFDDGTRGLPAGVSRDQAVRIPGDPSQRSAFVEAVTGAWMPQREDIPLNRSFGLTYGGETDVAGRQLGFIASGTYSNSFSTTDDLTERFFVLGAGPSAQVDYAGESTTHSVALGGLLNASYRLNETDRVSVNTVYNRLTDDQSRVLDGLFLSQGPFIWAPRLQYVSNELISSQLKGDHVLPWAQGATLKWRAGVSRAGRYEPNTRTVVYRAGEEGEQPEFFASPSSGLIFHQNLVDDGASGALDARLPFSFRALPASLSLGASADLRNRDVYTRRFRFVPTSGGLSGPELRLTPDELFVPERVGTQLDVVESTFREDNYRAGLDVLAGYLMLDAELLPGVRAVAGARLERAVQTVDPSDPLGLSMEPLQGAELENTDVLPALNLTLALAEEMSLRLGLSRTVARPQFRELTPFLYADYYGGLVSRGNPYIERSRIVNADLRWEWFFLPGALFSAGGFFKDFSQPIEPFAFQLGSSPAQTWVNTESASLYGAEVEVRATLGFLAPALEHLSLNANVTVAESRVAGDTVVIYDPDTGRPLPVASSGYEDRPLFGQSPYVLNLGATYRLPSTGTSATVLFNRFGRRLDAFGGQSLPDIYEEGRNQLDLVLGHPLGRGLELKLSASRLLGNEVRFTQTFPPDDETVTTRSYNSGRSFSLSVSWEPLDR